MRRCRPFDSSLQNTLAVHFNCTPATGCTQSTPQSTAPSAPKFHVLSRLGRASGELGRVPRDTSHGSRGCLAFILIPSFRPDGSSQPTDDLSGHFCVASPSAVGCSCHVRRLITHCPAAFIGCHAACRINERSGFAQVQLPHAAREGLLRLTLSAAMCEHVPASHNHGCVSWWKTRSTTDEPDLRCPPHDAALNDQHPVIEESGARAVASDTVHRTQVIQPVD